MELDKRIKEGKRPLTCFDIEEAKQYINKRCYFANADAVFSNLDNVAWLREGILTGVFEESEYPFCSHGVHSLIESRQIVPCEWVEEKKEPKEPKYREYKNLDEFFDVTGLEIGDLIKLKFPGNNVAELLIVGGCDNGLFIGIHKYTFKQLFEIVEISISGEWQPFGVLEE